MKITKQQLKQIITEEINQISEINESEYAREQLLELADDVGALHNSLAPLPAYDKIAESLLNIKDRIDNIASRL